MTALADMRRFAAFIIALWLIARVSAVGHVHGPSCCDHLHEHGYDHEHEKGHDHDEDQDDDDDDAPCAVCVAIHHVPFVPLGAIERIEASQEVVVWITPWIELVSDEVFFDRPLARGPPSAS